MKPEEGQAELRDRLQRYGGNVGKTARWFNIHRVHAWRLIRSLGMGAEVKAMRQRARTRFRIPPELLR